MAALVSLLVVLTLAFLVTRTATVALVQTGVSKPLARLQSISAFTGVGFTTAESESIVRHPVRRRVLVVLMILGNAGVVTAVSSLVLSFAAVQEAQEGATRALGIAAGLVVLWIVASSSWVEARLERVMHWALRRWTRLEARDYVRLLQLEGDFGIRELRVEEGDWVAERRLGELELMQEGVLVLGVRRADGSYVGVPRGETTVHAGDCLVLYGTDEKLADLDERRRDASGEAAHHEEVSETRRQRERQQEEEAAREAGRA